MFVREGSVYSSASDLTSAVQCEWGLMRRLDAKLGRIEAAPEIEDEMLARAGILGGEHELRALERYRARFGPFTPGLPGGVAEITEPGSKGDLEALQKAADETVRALRDGAEVVFQGTFLDTGFVGFADFLVRTEPVGDRWRYEVWDTKLARKAKLTALLQVAAYSRQLERLDIPIGDRVHLLLGDGTVSSHRLADIAPVYDERVARLGRMIDDRMASAEPIGWGAPGYQADGRCSECTVQVREHRDVLLTAGMRGTQRARLSDAGIHTIDQLALSSGDVAGIGTVALARLRDQARMQVAADLEPGEVRYRVHDPAGLAALPPHDDGDIFFDFEGDPLWTDEHAEDWGLDYLFGSIELTGDVDADTRDGLRFRPFWAHDRVQEKQALLDFLDYVAERRKVYPGLHIYHYADYERSHLQSLCARYGVGEAALDELLRENVLVDLYPIVKRSIRISENSYSLKKLEPLYMGDDLRQSDVKTGAGSITAYVDYTLLVAAGESDEAAALLAQIADYNRYDCVSTLRLRDWLTDRADEAGVGRRENLVPDDLRDDALGREEDTARAALLAPIENIPAADRDADQTALALAAAAIEYHRREDKTFWWEHFNREIAPIDEWADQRDVFVVDSAEVVSEWDRAPGKKTDSRVLRLRGRLAPGSRIGPGDVPHVMYSDPIPPGCRPVPAGQRGEHNRVTVIASAPDGTEVVIEERVSAGMDGWTGLPVAMTPGAPIPTRAQRQAILEWGRTVVDALPALTPDASLDLLRRIPPRLRNGHLAMPDVDDPSPAIVDTLLRLDRSYLAVQGPPGSGKTYLGSRVIAELVTEHHFRIGVVAQSHEVIENVLRQVVATGLDPDLVAKRARKEGYETAPGWTVLDANSDVMPFVLDRSESGFVLGGTAWDFSNASKVPRDGLDLLVIDEAGQFSLANTVAVAVSARNLLLLGDPQQLPQVSQGLHPEPVDRSALGWLSAGHDVLPAELGYFLARSWRMHPALCSAVSELAYEGRLSSKLPETIERELTGIAPGLHPIVVDHVGRSTESPEEASRVVELVRGLVGHPWTDPRRARLDGLLRASDVIVVAPYNLQVDLLRRMLDGAGFPETRVGTVDKFQGQEAAVAIVSLVASSAGDVPRGISFVLSRNRLNVAISRAQWAAYLVHSPALRDYLPYTAEGLAELSGFIRLASSA